MRLSRTGLATLILAVPLFTNAARAADDCANAQDQATMNECAGKSFTAADKKLNDAYRQIEGRLKDDAAGKKLLVDAQRAWVAFRDAECNFQGGPRENAGSMYPMVVADCQAALTKDRVRDFENYLNCPEGEVSCPVPAQ
ncbi:lysozyme inhibitor LprI family protein [Mesorhizobium sp. YC-39]|uniref:lysozyme inhibitor LprI family protein n=1 Tax=unclassified Mesorhizobium TaxID=325217 RepID=UPI0021E81334|nr:MULTISPECIES: lysozyme inhibitor LprI family protein [unclassified Mesorhizobium]MCV3206923.1 lysozyme inhibitor LprI family protein [Mesorhizobium sp. YC-2]MCV3228649.1 lysozyme inhibitor LprI family protein [Mesorhizobium sp. YC-39]